MWGGQERQRQYATGITVDWTDPRLASIDRLRYIGEGGILDFSYCLGTLRDGTKVHVRVPVYQVVRPQTLRNALLKAAWADHVFLKGLGGFDAISVND